jgi:prepilin-type N-terminal cleavage/methylation domain-containing protein
MSHSSGNGNGARGFTLIELLVTITVLAVVVTGLCDVFIANQKAWDRQSGASTALITTSTALSQVGAYLENAMEIKVATRYTSGDTLAVCMPDDKVYGIFVPSGGSYQRGASYVFYLSDSTGSYSKSGSILWAGTMPSWGDPKASNVTPDSTWSLYPGGTNGRITPVTSIKFTKSGDEYDGATMTVAASYEAGNGTATLTRTRNVCFRSQNY